MTRLPLLVDADWLAIHRDEVVVADVRWSPTGGTAEAQAAFEAGHIPGAVFFDIHRDLAAQPFVEGPGRHPLPSPETFAATLGRAGIGDDVSVVAYDDQRGSLAARLWWMLDATGRTAALLDGGLEMWAGALESGPAATVAPVVASERPWPDDRVADAAAVDRLLRDGGVVLDARAAERYRGDVEPIDPVAGHIPGARSAPWTDNLDGDGRFRSAAALRDRFTSLGIATAGDVIAHCGSGVTTCHDLFAIRLAGIGDARLYEGSWSDWVHDASRPVATGPDLADD